MLAYASLADLLTDVDQDIWADLPEPQRIAVDRVLLREQTADGVTDQRAVAAAFLSVVDRLSDPWPAPAGDRRPAMARSVQPTRARIRGAPAVRSGGTAGHCPHRT